VRLGAKVFLSTALVVVAVLGAALLVTGRQAGVTADAAVARALAATRASVSDALAGRSEQLRRAAEVLVLQTPYIGRIEAAFREGDRADLLDQVDEFRNQSGADWALLTDAAGVLAASTYHRGAFGEPLAEGAMVGLPLSEGRPAEGAWIEVDPEGRDLLFQAVGVPIVRPGGGGSLVGVLVLARAIDSAFVRELQLHTASDVVFFSLDTLGVPRAVVGTLAGDGVAPLLESVRLPEDPAAPADTTVRRGTLAGQEMLGAAGPLRSAAGFPLGGFLALRSRSAELAGFLQLRRTIIYAFAGSLVLALLSSLALARQVTRPVRALVAATRKVGEGQYSGRVEVRSRDEIGDLARAFDGMLKELRDKQQLVDYLQSAAERTVPIATAAASSEATVPRAPRPTVTGRLEPGQTLAGRYEIKALLGQGGMGMVYRAYDRQLGEPVALKTLRPELVAADSTTLERFKQEIRLARRITHRNVVRTHDLGEVDDMYFITMEYVAGTNLKDLIRQRGRLPVGITLTVGRQLCRALEVAHEQNVVHRDIKPHNIAVEPSGFIKVMDFGIARLMERSGEGLTQAGTAIGTPEYMAPEQLMGGTVDARSDLYAAGAVLFECLTGRLVFQAPSVTALVARHIEDQPEDPRRLNPEVPAPLAAVVLRALAKKPEERWTSAAELAEALEEIAGTTGT
jgi:serine/threonine-protein kinase